MFILVDRKIFHSPCSRDNIRYDLLRTGNVEVTSNKILERGYLDAVCIPLVINLAPHSTILFYTASSSIFYYLPSYNRPTTSSGYSPGADIEFSTNSER
jgi:hypothetical protein